MPRVSPGPVPAQVTVSNTGMHPVRAGRVPVQSYNQVVTPLPITGGQALLTIPGSGAAMATLGPTGLGTVWYPASVVVGTNVTPFDNSQVNVYVGPANVPTLLQGTIPYGGYGTVALAIPELTPGLYIIVTWSGATPGSQVSANVTGTMQALSW